MVTIKIGNLFDSKAETLVNTVNCVGVMGKGIAAVFKKEYPEMFKEYKEACNHKSVRPGELYPYYQDNKLKVLNFPTKEHWHSPSKTEYIVSGLDRFVKNYQTLNITSIAFPPLGCGNGGLNWDTVGPIMYEKLSALPINIEIYAPYGTESYKLTEEFLQSNNKTSVHTGVVYDKVYDNWNLVLQIVKSLEASQYSIKVGRTIFQKICYILSRNGTDLHLHFKRGTYGPYSEDIKRMITILSNNNLIIEKELGKMILLSVSDSFVFNYHNYSQKDRNNAYKTLELFRRISDTKQAELITTIIYSYDELMRVNKSVTEDEVFKYIVDWKKRYNNKDEERRIRELSKRLTWMDLIQVDYSKGFQDSEIY